MVFVFPMPGRGPKSSHRDPWRGFRFAARAAVYARTADRCEGADVRVSAVMNAGDVEARRRWELKQGR